MIVVSDIGHFIVHNLNYITIAIATISFSSAMILRENIGAYIFYMMLFMASVAIFVFRNTAFLIL